MENLLKKLNILITSSCIFLLSCEDFRLTKKTPKEFINHILADKQQYHQDSLTIVNILKLSLFKREDFFDNGAYRDSTQLIIDSILYSPNFSKIIVFLMTKNSVNRLSVPNEKYEWYYDATCYIGIRSDSSFVLTWLGPSFTNSYNRTELSLISRSSYFTEFATKDTIGINTYKYNLDDVRIWNDSIWNKIKITK